MLKSTIAIIGTGPAGLMAGTVLVQNGFKVVFFDQKKAPARKFLVAGNGGFNLTNKENLESFIDKYDSQLIQNAVRKFTNEDFIQFLELIGIQTYVGSSGKVFPLKGIKPIQVLNNWLLYLKNQGAEFNLNVKLEDFDRDGIIYLKGKDRIQQKFDKIIFSLGGGSWAKTGSDGKWLELFNSKGISCLPFKSSNSGIVCQNWDKMLHLDGGFIKNCKLFSDEIEKQGDLLISTYGLEGPPVYALNGKWRAGKAVYIDFKPMLTGKQILEKIELSKNPSEALKQLKLNKVSISILKLYLSKEEFINPEILSRKVKCFELPFVDFRPLDEVISTVGGIEMREVKDTFELKKIPGYYCIGEMLDWDAPTGGYLIQACVSSGYCAAKDIVNQTQVNNQS